MPSPRHAAWIAPLLLACAPVRPVPRDEPATTFTFGIPSGGVVEEQWLQRRAATVHFGTQPAHSTVDLVGGRTEERFEVQGDGTTVVTTTMLEHAASRDGRPLGQFLSFLGVPIRHRITATGAFVGGVDTAASLGLLRERLFGDEARLAFDAQLTPYTFVNQQESGWNLRFRDACGRAIPPGDVRWGFDVQELPTGASVGSLLRRTALGTVPDWPPALGRAPVRFFLEYGGTASPLAREPGADAFVASLDDVQARALSPRVEGRGEQLVDPSTCQVVREVVRLEGALQLDRDAARRAGIAGVVDRIDFRVDRQLVRGAPGSLPPLE